MKGKNPNLVAIENDWPKTDVSDIRRCATQISLQNPHPSRVDIPNNQGLSPGADRRETCCKEGSDLSAERFGLISLCVARTLRTGRLWDQNCSVGLRPGSYTRADGAEYQRSRYVSFGLT
jgi:hypothetical protein